MKTYEDGLVKIYFGKIKSLALDATCRSVHEEVENHVKKAVEHFAMVQTSTELGNLQRFMALLNFAAETTLSSQLEIHSTLEHAAQLVSEMIQKCIPSHSIRKKSH